MNKDEKLTEAGKKALKELYEEYYWDGQPRAGYGYPGDYKRFRAQILKDYRAGAVEKEETLKKRVERRKAENLRRKKAKKRAASGKEQKDLLGFGAD